MAAVQLRPVRRLRTHGSDPRRVRIELAGFLLVEQESGQLDPVAPWIRTVSAKTTNRTKLNSSHTPVNNARAAARVTVWATAPARNCGSPSSALRTSARDLPEARDRCVRQARRPVAFRGRSAPAVSLPLSPDQRRRPAASAANCNCRRCDDRCSDRRRCGWPTVDGAWKTLSASSSCRAASSASRMRPARAGARSGASLRSDSGSVTSTRRSWPRPRLGEWSPTPMSRTQSAGSRWRRASSPRSPREAAARRHSGVRAVPAGGGAEQQRDSGVDP